MKVLVILFWICFSSPLLLIFWYIVDYIIQGIYEDFFNGKPEHNWYDEWLK